MLESILERLHGLLMEGRIEYDDLQAITNDIPSLSDTELDSLVNRLAALHRLMLAFKEQRQPAAGGSSAPVTRRRRSRKEASDADHR